jgi:hypothetical protein
MVSGDHSIPEVEIKVRRIDPNRDASTPKAPMYRERSWSWGELEAGYEGGRETRMRIETSSWDPRLQASETLERETWGRDG